MRTLLIVENSDTIRLVLMRLVRKRFADIEPTSATRISAAKDQIEALAPRAFDLAILDWSLADGNASELLPLLTLTRIMILTKHALRMPGMVVIQKDDNCLARVDEELRK